MSGADEGGPLEKSVIGKEVRLQRAPSWFAGRQPSSFVTDAEKRLVVAVESYEASYACCCGDFFPITALYYCQGCMTPKCRFCINESVQCHYCPSCLQNVASAEATLNKNRCRKCFSCPCCFTGLKLAEGYFQLDEKGRVQLSEESTVQGGRRESSGVQKMPQVYLQCGFCRWTSLEVGWHAGSVAHLQLLIGEKEKEKDKNENFKELVELLQKEEYDKMREKKRRRRSAHRAASLLVLSGQANLPGSQTLKAVEQAQQRKSEALSFAGKQKIAQEACKQKIAQEACKHGFQEALTVGNTASFSMNEACSMQQLNSYVPHNNEAKTAKELVPIRQVLQCIRSKHCSTCDKILVKPGINPSNVEFKRCHTGVHFLPRVRIEHHMQPLEELTAGKQSTALVLIQNPIDAFVRLRIKKVNEEEEVATAQLQGIPSEGLATFLPPAEFDKSVDDMEGYHELEKELPDVAAGVVNRSNSTIVMHLSFIPTGPIGAQTTVVFLASLSYKLPTGEQDVALAVKLSLGPCKA